MQGINKVILMGRLGRDPELRQTASGKALCRLTIATNHKVRREGSWVEETDWHDVVLWEEQAERASRVLGSGDLCSVDGRLAPRVFEDAQGQRRRVVEVVANRWQLMSSNRPRREQQASAPDPAQEARSAVAMPTDEQEAAPF
jgi:single-strand DNA-binding protein